MITIPDAFISAVLRLDSPDAQRWLDALPQLVATLCDEWGLALDGPPMHGGLSLVVPVRRGDERCVLKLAHARADAAVEALALATWDGQGAVRLLDVEPTRGALLLERLDASRSMRALPADEAFTVTGQLLRRLAVPAPDGVPLLRELAARLVTGLQPRWERLGRPVPAELLAEARQRAATLGPAAATLLIHSDLYDDNVLAGERESWLAIDPRAVAGDAEFGVAPLLVRRLDELSGPDELRHHLGLLCAAAELEFRRARDWSLVRCIDYWLWGLSVGLTEDPVRCERLAAWLAEL